MKTGTLKRALQIIIKGVFVSFTPWLSYCHTLNTPPISEAETSRLNQLSIIANISKAQWLLSELKYLEEESKSSQGNLLTRLKLKSTQQKHEALSEELLTSCQNVDATQHPLLISRCIKTLEQLDLMPTQQAQLDVITHSLKETLQIQEAEIKLMNAKENELESSPRTSDSAQPQVAKAEVLSKQIDRAIEMGDLPKTQKLLGKLAAQEGPLPLEIALKVDAIHNFLTQQIQTLDKQADQLYQQGYVDDANAIWGLLLKLTAGNETIQSKFTRSSKVLGNLEELRKNSSANNSEIDRNINTSDGAPGGT